MRTTPLALMVVPLYNEEEGVDPPVKAVRAAMADVPEWELILIDDGSQDRTPEMAEKAWPRATRAFGLATWPGTGNRAMQGTARPGSW